MLRYQTVPPDETLVLCSNLTVARLREDFPEALFLPVEDKGDWGHAKRAEGLALAAGEYVGFFNDDDLYDRRYVEKMLQAVDGFDAVFCDWNGHVGTVFQLGSSTSGNFIVRTGLARAVGWNHRMYEADGMFIEDLKAAGCYYVKLNENLYTHNP